MILCFNNFTFTQLNAQVLVEWDYFVTCQTNIGFRDKLCDEGTYIGLLHFLYENVIPPPHFLVHALYGPQGPQLPSTGFNLRFFTHWPLIHHCDLIMNKNVKFLRLVEKILSHSYE